MGEDALEGLSLCGHGLGAGLTHAHAVAVAAGAEGDGLLIRIPGEESAAQPQRLAERAAGNLSLTNQHGADTP